MRNVPSKKLRLGVTARQLDAIGKQGRRQSNHTSWPGIRLIFLGVSLMLVLAWLVFGTGDPPAAAPARKHVRRPIQPAAKAPAIPEPVGQPALSVKLDTRMRLISPKPEAEAATLPEEGKITKTPNDSAFDEDGFYVRYLERQSDADKALRLLPERLVGKGGTLAFGQLQAGYGRIFTDDSVITRGRNGTTWEEASCLYVKASFRF